MLSLPDARPLAAGKVRDLYEVDESRLLLVASDRLSAFDVVLPTPIPDKGLVLTGLTLFWLARTAEIVPNHLLGARAHELPESARTPELLGRTMLCRRLRMLPIECVVRGYLAGSGWRDYRRTGAVSGHPLPAGLVEAERLPAPLFTPATKATSGHDENIDRASAADLVGAERLAEAEAVSLALYRHGAAHAERCGLILADTKFEFGLDDDDRLVLADEVLTPDSSRFWAADRYRPGSSPPSYDKQYVRDHLETLPWDKTPPGPELPDEVVRGVSARYREVYARLTGRDLAHYRQTMGAPA
jgi:phosphoribosylaminoimidazole-succinocarboxamide synthase